ncbi:ligase-associated DNA damage response endonuclease PdeM [Parasphingorhabdus sp. JC815]|uniref:ligase-associated DNA damage response endonuclease PdeM n=1 Tax=Parasphingorhabdus sp. JC815 TaxID=3232140 RepID=UPI003459BB2B
MRKSIVYESHAGPIVLDAVKAAFLPRSRTLLVADLHFEKGSYLQSAGNALLPPYDTLETLSRLNRAIAAFRPEHIVALGDSFHDAGVSERIDKKHVEMLNNIVNSTARFTWILGNHDPEIPATVEGEREDHLEVEGFLLTHLPVEAGPGQINICGHLHPKASLKIGRGKRSYPCFACSSSRIILPSFGAYTGGLSVEHPAIKNILGDNKFFMLTSPSGIYPIKALRAG